MALLGSFNQIAGLHRHPILADLQNSTNGKTILSSTVKNLCQRYPLPTFKLSQKFWSSHKLRETSGCLYRPIPMDEVNLAEVHGHVFKLVDEHRFIAYEYVEGKARGLSQIGIDFFKELAEYVRLKGLDGTVGLQIRGPATEKMVELDLGDCGTVMLKAQETCHGTPFRTTGWVFDCDNGVASFKGSETHAPTIKGPHKVFIGGKLAPDVPGLKAVLRSLDVIN